MKIADLMDRKHPTVRPDVSAAYARTMFRKFGVRVLPVISNERLVGILSRINIMNITATRSDLMVSDIVETPLVTLYPNEDLFNATKKLLEIDEWYAPVINDKQIYLGVYGLEHFIGYMINQDHPANFQEIEKYMTREIEVVYVDDPISKVWRKMLTFRYAGFPVVTSKNKLIGIITQIDLLKHGFTRLHLESESAPRRGPKVRDIMSTPPITVSPKTIVKDAAKTMIDRNIGRLLVIDNKELVGIIDRDDISRAYLMF